MDNKDKNPSQLLRQLICNAKLSNQISSNALLDATNAWRQYTKQPTSKRDFDDVQYVFDQLVIINNQIHWGLCKINPTQWHNFCALFCLIKNSLETGKVLEPKADKAANDGNKQGVA